MSVRKSKLRLLGGITDVANISINNSGVVFDVLITYNSTKFMRSLLLESALIKRLCCQTALKGGECGETMCEAIYLSIENPTNKDSPFWREKPRAATIIQWKWETWLQPFEFGTGSRGVVQYCNMFRTVCYMVLWSVLWCKLFGTVICPVPSVYNV